jgi:hypothetical protein
MAAATTWSLKHVAPAGEGQVAAQDRRGVFASGGDQLEEQVGGVLLDVADLANDQPRVAAQLRQLGGEAAVLVGGLQPGDPVDGGGEQDPVPVLGRGDAQADGQPTRATSISYAPDAFGHRRQRPIDSVRPGNVGRSVRSHRPRLTVPS